MVGRQQQVQDPMVRVVVALIGAEGLREAERPIPAVVAFDENKKYIGASCCENRLRSGITTSRVVGIVVDCYYDYGNDRV